MRSVRDARRIRLSSTSVLALCLACGLSEGARADSSFWIGGTNDWFLYSNLSLGSTSPDSGDTARIDSSGVVIDGASAAVGTLFLGLSSAADLTIEDDLASDSVSLGWNSGSTGTAIASGTGNVWTNTGAIYVGNGGGGVISILDGAAVSTGEMNIASGTTSTGTVTLQRVGTDRTAVIQVLQDFEALQHDVVGFPALDVGDETHAAGIMFIGGIVKTLLLGQIHLLFLKRQRSSRVRGRACPKNERAQKSRARAHRLCGLHQLGACNAFW